MPLAPTAILRTFNYVMYFNGQNASAVVSPNPAFYGSQLTIDAWFAIISNPSSWAGVVDTTVYNTNNWWIYTVQAGYCQALGGVQYSGGGIGAWYPQVNCGEAILHQYVLEINGNNVSLFFDGELYYATTGSGSYVTDTSLPLVIGVDLTVHYQRRPISSATSLSGRYWCTTGR